MDQIGKYIPMSPECVTDTKRSMQQSSSEQISTWGSRPAATYGEGPDGRPQGEVAECVRQLSIAFPAMPTDFWVMLTQRFKALGFCRERLQYILHVAIDTDALINQYRYNRLCVADFTSITKPIESFSYSEAYEMYQNGRRDLVWINIAPKKSIIVTKDAAEFAGYQYKLFQV